jgi:hypothetical protein
MIQDTGYSFVLWGMLATSLGGVFSSLLGYFFDFISSAVFFQLIIEDGSENSPDFLLKESLYKHIVKNKSSFQRMKVKLVRQNPKDINSNITGHSESLPDGGVFFWNTEEKIHHLFYAEYTNSGVRYWDKEKIIIYGLRCSMGNLERLLDKIVFKEDEPIKYMWKYSGSGGDDHCWLASTGKDRYLETPVYIPSPDTEKVIRDIDMCVKAWSREKKIKLIRQCNKGCFLLQGPPGTYKTTLVRYISTKIRLNLCVATHNDISIDTFKNMISSIPKRSVFLLDDMDMSIFNAEKSVEDDEYTRDRFVAKKLKAVIKSVMDGTVVLPEECLFFICCNDEKIDDAISSRFTPYFLGLPDSCWKEKLFLHLFPREKKISKLFSRSLEDTNFSQRNLTRTIGRSYKENCPMETYKTCMEMLGCKTISCDISKKK